MSEPIESVEAAAAMLRASVRDVDHSRIKRNTALRAARYAGISVDDLVEMTGLGRSTIFAAMRDVTSDAKRQDAAMENLQKVLAEEAVARNIEAARRADRDAAIIDAHNKRIPVTRIAKAAQLDRTQLYKIFGRDGR